jgi:uncharacterized repeat protein (TIGR01451 family)
LNIVAMSSSRALRALRFAIFGVLFFQAVLISGTASAAGTAAGTVINSAADVSFDVGGNTLALTSNTVTVTVDERIDVVVTLQSPQVLVAGGDTNRSVMLRVTNTGNGSELFQLAIDSNVPGNDFNPVPTVPAIYFDTDASGDFSIGDVAYSPGSNDPVLAADGFVDILLVNDIPLAVSNGQSGFTQLTATSVTGTGNPGDAFSNQGDGGVDAVVGTTGGNASGNGEYLVSDVAVTIVKTVIVADPFGGTQPVPGATLTYSIAVQVSNSGTATNSIVNDPVPADTTFVPSSITLNGAPLTDATDGDSGEHDTSGTPSIVVRLGDLTQADGVQSISFQVTID